MKAFSTFNISSFEWDPATLKASFHYNFDQEKYFTEVIDFSPLKDKSDFPILSNTTEEVSQLLAHLHIALGISYYKLFPTVKICIENFTLDEEQEKFWNTFYIKGLGEFFYQNKLDPRGLAHFFGKGKVLHYDKKVTFNGIKSLVLFGGGKDSLVTVELLKEKGSDFDLFSFGKDYVLHQIAQNPTNKKRLVISRELDLTQIKEMIGDGYYNGHVPITGVIYFVSLVVSYLYGYNAVISSLEKSADFGNTLYYDLEINHQWSKSLEFEKAFLSYVHTYISSDFSALSLLRERYEIKVVQQFCKYPQYFHNFSSCNRNFHQSGSKLSGKDLWCGKCPKCAFVYTMMRAFLDKEQVNDIFGHDLFEDSFLLPLFSELLGVFGIKPFECVGTNEEMILALYLILKKEKKSDSPILELFRSKVACLMEESDFKRLESKLLD